MATERIKTLILDEFEVLFNDNNVTSDAKMEIADIFLLNKREERGHQILAVLRGYRVNDISNTSTIYDDSQNVHDKKSE